jgi:CRISPR-associated protein Cmr3
MLEPKNTSIITLRIAALDTLFFRDGKPFTQGDDSHLETINFPPAPSVFLGAVKTMLAAHHNWDLADINTKAKNISIKKIYFDVKGLNFITPLDYAERSDKSNEIKKEENIKKQYESLKTTSCISNTDLILNEKYKQVSSLFASQDKNIYLSYPSSSLFNKEYLLDYLDLDNSKNIYVSKPKIYNESKIGIKRDTNSHGAENGMLYNISMQRLPEDFYICVELEIDNTYKVPGNGYLKLGGEAKIAYFTMSLESKIDKDLKTIKFFRKSDYFKIYLNTPALFKNGWQPDLKTTLGIDATLFAANIGKPIPIGGFNMQNSGTIKKGHKSMYRAVPAGAVYIYKVSEENKPQIAQILKENQGVSICDIGDAQKIQEGFGIAFFGNA